MKLTVQKTDAGLIPMRDSYDDYATIKPMEIVVCEIKRPRNLKFHRKYFALLNIAYENRQVFEDMSFDNFRKEIICRAGYYDTYTNFKGELSYSAKSISFAKMSSEEFEILYSKSIDVILKYVLVGMDSEELRSAVNEIVSF